MPNLFDIIGEYQQQLQQLADIDMPPEAVMDTIESFQGDVENKLRAVVAYALQLEHEAEARSKEAKRMAEGAEALERRAEALKTYAQIGLMNSGLKLPLVLPEFTLNVAKMPPSCEITDEAALPNNAVLTTVVIDAVGRHEGATVKEKIAALFPTDGTTTIEVKVRPIKRVVLNSLKTGAKVEGAKLTPTAYRMTVR